MKIKLILNYSNFQQINHNRYLKMLYKTPYQISNIDRISMFIRFDTQLNNKFIVL